jgi:hypothetical protein
MITNNAPSFSYPSRSQATKTSADIHLFLLGRDYHLGDLLWFTTVLRAYRQQRQPRLLLVGCPDRPVSRILEHNPLIDELRYGQPRPLLRASRAQFGLNLLVHDMRPLTVARVMLRDWRHHWPWLYYRDLWLQERGQWLATFLHLRPLTNFRPVLRLRDEDRQAARSLTRPYVLLAPRTGRYGLPLTGALWRGIKEWGDERWCQLASRLRKDGYLPITLGAAGQAPVAGSEALLGLPVRQAAGVVERAAALVSVESGLWFVAAALGTPFLIVPWWLPRSVNWAAPMRVPHRLVARRDASVGIVAEQLRDLLDGNGRS